MEIREAKLTDAPGITHLCVELGYVASEAKIKERLRSISAVTTDCILVAKAIDGELKGWIQGHISHVLESGFRAEIAGLIVANSSRRSGVGRKLVAAIESWAQSNGASVIVVRSNTVRAESHAFYPALGYVETKTQRVYRKQLTT